MACSVAERPLTCVVSVTLNADGTTVGVATTTGFLLFNTDPFQELQARSIDGGVGLLSLYQRAPLLLLASHRNPCRVVLWNDAADGPIPPNSAAAASSDSADPAETAAAVAAGHSSAQQQQALFAAGVAPPFILAAFTAPLRVVCLRLHLNFIAMADERHAYICDDSMHTRHRVPIHYASPNCIAVPACHAPSSGLQHQLLFGVVGPKAGTVQLYAVSGLRPYQAPLELHSKPVASLALSADGTQLMTISMGGTAIKLTYLPSVADGNCRQLNRGTTQQHVVGMASTVHRPLSAHAKNAAAVPVWAACVSSRGTLHFYRSDQPRYYGAVARGSAAVFSMIPGLGTAASHLQSEVSFADLDLDAALQAASKSPCQEGVFAGAPILAFLSPSMAADGDHDDSRRELPSSSTGTGTAVLGKLIVVNPDTAAVALVTFGEPRGADDDFLRITATETLLLDYGLLKELRED